MALQDAGLSCRAGAACGIAPLARLDVTVRQGKKGAYLTGLARCRSVNGCAACREDKWTALRREFKAVFDLHIATGGIFRLLTLTCPHSATERFVWVLRDLLAAWVFFANSRAVRDLQKRGAFFRRVLEVVHGNAQGWHPHFHVPMFLPAMAEEEEERVVTKLRAAWIKAMKRASGGKRVPLARHQDWNRDVHPAYATKGDVRHRTESEPHGSAAFELARAATLGDPRAVVLFREYVAAMAELSPRLATPWTKAYPKDLVAAELAAQAAVRAAAAEQSQRGAAVLTDVGRGPQMEAPEMTTAAAGTAAPGESAASTKYVPPAAGTVIAVIPRGYWALLAPVRGIKRAVLRAADEGGLDGIAECIAPVLWTRFTGEHESKTPPDLVGAVRQAIQPKAIVEGVSPAQFAARWTQ